MSQYVEESRDSKFILNFREKVLYKNRVLQQGDFKLSTGIN